MLSELGSKVYADGNHLPNCQNGPPCDGGCFEACVATLTGLDPAHIPCTDECLQEAESRGHSSWLRVFNEKVAPHGWFVTFATHREGMKPSGYWIIHGPSGDDGGMYDHAVIAHDGEQVFDPSYDVGVTGPELWYAVHRTG